MKPKKKKTQQNRFQPQTLPLFGNFKISKPFYTLNSEFLISQRNNIATKFPHGPGLFNRINNVARNFHKYLKLLMVPNIANEHKISQSAYSC